MLLTTVLCTAAAVASLTLASAVVIMPIGGLHIVWGVVFGHFINDEKISMDTFLSVFFLVIGVGLVIAAGTQTHHEPSEHGVMEYFYAPAFLVFFVVWIFVAIGLIVHALTQMTAWPRSARFSSACASGFLGAGSNIMAKATMEIITHIDLYDNREWLWLFLSITVVLAIAQLAFLNRSLAYYEAVYVVPTVNATLMTMGTIFGLVFFQEYRSFSVATWICLPTGVVLAITGVLLLSERTEEEPMSPCSTKRLGQPKPRLSLTPISMSPDVTPESDRGSDEGLSLISVPLGTAVPASEGGHYGSVAHKVQF